MRSWVPTPEQGLAYEKFHSYRHGWTDGAKGQFWKRKEFSEHPTRPDLAAEYIKGYEDGETIRRAALAAAAARVGYEPSPLRGSEEK